ncbi:hypothetical protein [Paucibacter sp. M5-1]|uniref:hypothetical protein n=1 Tax=Paucibacter sp. M5-1 TaxID=3015998 RepID=UPI0022B904F6|nr:hypothetical protein [Paucibacter sp. M5-1]MCZ7883981.1 hypothetical protein [Paucibacter sp. M5-1]
MTPASIWCHRALVTLHLVLAVAGGWAVIALAVPLAGIALAALGMIRSEATVLAMMLGFIAYLLLLIWAFSVRLPRLLAGLLGSAMLCGLPLYVLS